MKLLSRMAMFLALIYLYACTTVPAPVDDKSPAEAPNLKVTATPEIPDLPLDPPKEIKLAKYNNETIYSYEPIQSVSMDIQLDMASNEASVPMFLLEFGDAVNIETIEHPKINLSTQFKLQVSDENCTGEYSSQVSYSVKQGLSQYHFLESKIPWPETFTVKIQYLGQEDEKFTYEVDVYDEKVQVETHKRVNGFDLYVRKQAAYISNIQIVEE